MSGDAEHERLSAKAERGTCAPTVPPRGEGGVQPGHVGGLGRGGLAARTARRGARLEPRKRRHRVLARSAIRSVVAVGLGVAGTACEAIATLGGPDLAVPLTVGHGSELPVSWTATRLVIALAAPPGSAETDAAVRAAHAVGVHVLTVGTWGWPGLLRPVDRQEDAVRSPAITGARSGRVTLAGLVVPVLVALERLRLGRDWTADLQAASAALAKRRDALMTPGGLPEVLARHIGRTFPPCTARRGSADRGDMVEGRGQPQRQVTGLRGRVAGC